MSSFLSQIRKGSSNKSSRVVYELARENIKLRSQNTVIEDEGLIDNGSTSKGRLIAENGKLLYTRKITVFPTHKVPEEPDGDLLVLWVKANHTGLYLKDSSKYNGGVDDFQGSGGTATTTIKANNNRHFCLTDSGGLDLGYLGTYNGVNSVTAWDLNGVDESAQVIDILTNQRLRVKDTTVGISISAWVKIDSFEQHNSIGRRIVAKSDDGDNAYALFISDANRAVFAVKHAGVEYKVMTPATLVADTWYFIVGTFKSTATKEAKIYLNGVVSTTAYASSITYPVVTYLPGVNFQLFTNGKARTINPLTSDLPPPYDNDTGNFHGMARDVRVWREKILSQTEVTNFNNNKVSITDVGFGGSYIAGFVWSSSDIATTSSFTSQSFSTVSFNT